MASLQLQIIAGGKLGDESTRAAVSDLYQRYGGSVYGRCLYLVKNRSQAEDATQDVFAKALQNLGGFRAEASPLTWLMRIATNHCLNLIRAERAGWHARFERQERQRSEATPTFPADEIRALVRHVLEQFDPETQAAAIHYYVDEMTLDEVATALDRSVPTVRKRLAAFAAACGKVVATTARD